MNRPMITHVAPATEVVLVFLLTMGRVKCAVRQKKEKVGFGPTNIEINLLLDHLATSLLTMVCVFYAETKKRGPKSHMLNINQSKRVS